MPTLACVGIDQSYKRTGLSVSIGGRLVSVNSYELHRLTKHEARKLVSEKAVKAVSMCFKKVDNVIVLLERIRLFSQQFISMPYIMSMGEMNGAVYDKLVDSFKAEVDSGRLEVMTVETKAWKKAVIGSTKGAPNDYGVPENKWPSIEWFAFNYQDFESKVLHKSKSRHKTKSNFEIDGKFYEYDDDAVDSACISLFPFSSHEWSSRLESIE